MNRERFVIYDVQQAKRTFIIAKKENYLYYYSHFTLLYKENSHRRQTNFVIVAGDRQTNE